MPPGYRYVSQAEVQVIQAANPSRLPNVDPAGMPKTVYFAWDFYASASQAELALQVGVHNPSGPTPSPSDRLDLDLTGITYTNWGIVPGGTGTEVRTLDSPLVTAITPLGPWPPFNFPIRWRSSATPTIGRGLTCP